jgi:intraflagellar transport protein 81
MHWRRAKFQASVLAGDRSRIHPILHYLLTRLDVLKKRAYVAKYLVPVEIPPEYLHDDTTQDLYTQLTALQAEFRETHKAVDSLRTDSTDPAELRKEITQLESEKRQLKDRIEMLKDKTAGIPGFAALFEATSSLRKQQEEEAKLAERLHEQRAALAGAEQRYRAVARRLAEARSKNQEDVSAAQLVANARREMEENTRLLDSVLPKILESRRGTLAGLQDSLSQPRRGMEDVRTMQERVRGADSALQGMVQRLVDEKKAAGDTKLAMFHQQSVIVTRKLLDKEVEVERLRKRLEEARAEVERRECKLAETAGSRHMRKDEFAAYAASLRTKMQQIKVLKAEQSAMRQETVVLGRTEELLKQRAGGELIVSLWMVVVLNWQLSRRCG